MTGERSTLPRLLAAAQEGRMLDLNGHVREHGELPPLGPGLIESVARAGLRGRGGAAFLTATKLQAVLGGSRAPVVVANGAESEPASAKDRLLLESVPHLVLDGAVAAARAVGAERIVVAVKAAQADTVAHALSQRTDGTGDGVALRVVTVGDHYLAGEESALVHHLNGGPALPTVTPPRPFERGVDRRRTLIQNAETLAHIALIARHGPHWFRELGTASEPGSTLVTLCGDVGAPGVYEISRGSSLDALLRAAQGTGAVGTAGHEPLALLLGGYFGTWIAGSAAGTLALEDADLSAHGGALGCGVVAVLPRSGCGPAESARVARFLADQSARQCGPCTFGLPAIADALECVLAGRASATVWHDVRRRLRQVQGRGACQHPNGAVRFVSSSLRVFAEQWEDHAAHGPCEGCRDARMLPMPPPSHALVTRPPMPRHPPRRRRVPTGSV